MAGTNLTSAFSQLLPPGLPQPVVAGAQRLLGIARLQHVYDTLQSEPGTMAGRLLKYLKADSCVSPEDLKQVPVNGPLVVVANHPFGILEGAILAELLLQVRPDVKFLANSLMHDAIAEIRYLLLPVNPFSSSSINMVGAKRSIEHLTAGGALVIFPAGEVSHYRWRAWQQGISDPEWRSSVARIARLSGATVVPAYVRGVNSAWFHAASLVHPRLRTALLIRELLNKRGAKVEVRIGTPVTPARLAEMSSDQERTRYLRWRTYWLAHRNVRSGEAHRPACSPTAAADDLPSELPQEHLQLESPEFAVYLAPASAIPGVLHEIGRLRELTFRAVGEGTGKRRDLDEFDAHYLHLFLWHKESRQVAGAYRLAPCDAILARRGVAGLYSASLFRLGPEFLRRLEGDAIELGRSFIRKEFQKSFAPLLMLWKGIGRFIGSNPRYTTLFGPVSISNQYREISRQLMVNFLENRAMEPELARWISTRNGYRPRLSGRVRKFAHGGAGMLTGIDDLSAAVSDLDPGGVPVLLRQYLSLGGKLLGFNVDPQFTNALDGLIMVDLRQTKVPLLERLLGKREARAFLALHNSLDDRRSGHPESNTHRL